MQKTQLMLALAIAGFSASALATNGMVSHGTGIKHKAMGGVGAAYVSGAMSGASNPASMAVVGKSMEVGVDIFAPDRNTSITGNGAGFNMSMHANEDSNFLIPEFAYNTMLDANKSLGIVVYGNGGMNTSYPDRIAAFGTSKAGIDLAQMFIAPTMSIKLNEQHSVGASMNLAYQRFKASGLENFNNAAQTSAVGSVTNNGYDDATGFGVRLGWLGQVSPTVSVGAFYQTETNMSKFDKYKGLFAEQGNLDIPSMYGLGISVKASPKTTVAVDVQQINYSDVKAMSNPLGPVSAFGVLSKTLGTDNGAGFGWRDMTVFKIGVEHQLNNDLTLRAGWNYARQPIPNGETFFNLLAPGVVEQHLTLGASWKTAGGEWNVSYMHAFEKEVLGSGSVPAGFGAGEANLKMSQDALGVSYSWKM
ncbi:MAG: outer membrane protein transport protein [Betaproteobacteria bacterium]|nr:outer membrane protein transport protein [Betaproteobacteria bacterium]